MCFLIVGLAVFIPSTEAGFKKKAIFKKGGGGFGGGHGGYRGGGFKGGFGGGGFGKGGGGFGGYRRGWGWGKSWIISVCLVYACSLTNQNKFVY